MRRFWIRLGSLALAAVLCATPIGAAPQADTLAQALKCDSPKEPDPLTSRTFAFPRDDGKHDAFPLEMWRTFGRLHDPDGNRYAFSVNVSRFQLDACGMGVRDSKSRWFAKHVMTLSYELLDEQTQHVERGENVERETSVGGSIDATRLGIAMGHIAYRTQHSGARAAFDLAITGGPENGLSLAFQRSMAPIPLGPDGIAHTGSCEECEAYGYEVPRNATSGTMRIAGVDHAVTGATWFEHEFARRELAPIDVGWNRYEVQFDDGRLLDVRLTRNYFGIKSATSGVFVAADGKFTYLVFDDARQSNFPPGNRWHSTETNVTYPDSWFLGVHPANLGLAVVGITQDQEVRAIDRRPFYWGAVDVEKAAPPGGDHGEGFVELTGYGGPIFL